MSRTSRRPRKSKSSTMTTTMTTTKTMTTLTTTMSSGTTSKSFRKTTQRVLQLISEHRKHQMLVRPPTNVPYKDCYLVTFACHSPCFCLVSSSLALWATFAKLLNFHWKATFLGGHAKFICFATSVHSEQETNCII